MDPSPDTPINPRELRNALGRFASGVSVITTRRRGQVHGMTANAFVSVSLTPPLVLVSVDQRANMHRLLSVGGRYGLSFLAEDQVAISDHFAGRDAAEAPVTFVTKQGMPVLEGAVAHLVARVVEAHPVGDHTLYVGQVEYFDWRDDDRPLIFYAGTYQRLREKRSKPTLWAEDDFSLFSIGEFSLQRR